MGAVYSYCFPSRGGSTRADDYKINELQVDNSTAKTYSWDKRDAIDPRDYTIESINNQILIKQPGSICGQQFIVQNCQGCTVLLLDYSATVTVDDCIDCNILIGPCKGSVFIRDCRDCRMIIACQQYRARDCTNMDTYLLCKTQPIIESCSDMRFGCVQLYYEQLQEHLDQAELSVFNNNWSKIHDFTPSNTSKNYSYNSESTDQLEALNVKTLSHLGPYNVRSNRETSVVPLTLGKRPRPFKEVMNYHSPMLPPPMAFLCQVCFCLTFPTAEEDSNGFVTRCSEMVREVSKKEGCRLVSTNAITMTPTDAQRLTGAKYISTDSLVIATDWIGPTAAQSCRRYCQRTHTAEGQMAMTVSKEFYNYVNMQHGV